MKQDQKVRGRYLGGKVPFGYRVTQGGSLAEHEGEQAAIRAIRAMREQCDLSCQMPLTPGGWRRKA